MNKPFSTYSTEVLPLGFQYPRQFVEYAESGVHPTIEPWWFVDASTKAGELMWSVRAHDGRNLIPFAKMDDDLACFDGDNRSGSPEVVLLALDESRRQYSWPDFGAWIEAARTSATRYGSA